MNLELLAPRQIPDRIDSTLQLPPLSLPSGGGGGGGEGVASATSSSAQSLSSSSPPPNNNTDNSNNRAANYVTFNRRGSYIAVGYGNGTLAVYDVLSRTLSGLYYYNYNNNRNDASSSPSSPSNSNSGPGSSSLLAAMNGGINLISWSRRSRTILAGSVGCKEVWLIDATHPYGSECAIVKTTTDQQQQKERNNNKDDDKDNDESESQKNTSSGPSPSSSSSSSFLNPAGSRNDFVRRPGKLQTIHLPSSSSSSLPNPTSSSPSSSCKQQKPKRQRQTLVGASSVFSSSSTSTPSPTTTTTATSSSNTNDHNNNNAQRRKRLERFPWVQFELPAGVGGDGVGNVLGGGGGGASGARGPSSTVLQIHPRDNCSGHATLEDGSIVAFRVPVDSFNTSATCTGGNSNNAQQGDGGNLPKLDDEKDGGAEREGVVLCATIYQCDEHFITCSAWDAAAPTSHMKKSSNSNNNTSSSHPDEAERLYATTRDGKLLGFDVSSIFDALATAEEKWRQHQLPSSSSSSSSSLELETIPMVEPKFVIQIPGGAETWQVTVNRTGSHLVVNSADAALRTYDTKECWGTTTTTAEDNSDFKPKFAFQDVVSKVKFVSCDFSSDGEYLVGCANSGEASRYELYIWNTETGALMDKLSGASVEASAVKFHPTRSFIAVSTSDGLVDVWGHKMSWTQFAPDFQALPANVEYVECEDEFDSVVVVKNTKENIGDSSNTNNGGGGGDGGGRNDTDPADQTTADTVNTNIIGDNNDGKQVYGQEDHDDDDDDDDEEEKEPVDVITIEPVTVFQSDSEDEEDVFYFETRIVKPPPQHTAATSTEN